MNEWDNEPDNEEFSHAGLACRLKRNPHMGNWCGYVGVDKDHPLHGIDYDTVNLNVEVHGGLTYSTEENGIWWLGFDCAHHRDLLPSSPRSGGTYRTIGFTKEQTMVLAEQLREAAL